MIHAQKPYVLAAVKSEQVAAAMLFTQSEALEELFHEGMLLEKEYEDMLRPIKEANTRLHMGPKVLREAQMLHVGEGQAATERADGGPSRWVTSAGAKVARI